MRRKNSYASATDAWLSILKDVFYNGAPIAPRKNKTLERLSKHVSYPMTRPVVDVPARKLNYSFMAAEAMWILSGDDTVAGIAPWCKNIAQFSDDGVRFAGAYGPPIADQLSYAVSKLVNDRDTRQSVITIWKPNPPPSKDIPCTVALTFMIRRDRLHAHIFMRSSDAWLGVPYDFFNFAMIGARMAYLYNLNTNDATKRVEPGNVYWTAASSHLYMRDFEKTLDILDGGKTDPVDRTEPLPARMVLELGGWENLWASLAACRDKKSVPTNGWGIRS